MKTITHKPLDFFQKSPNETRFFRQFLQREQKMFLWLLYRGFCQLEKDEISKMEILGQVENLTPSGPIDLNRLKK